MTGHITAHDFIGALVDAGILRDGDGILRVVIDAHIGHLVVLHVQRHADQRLLDVVPGLDGVEIREQAKPPVPAPERPIDLDDRTPRPARSTKFQSAIAGRALDLVDFRSGDGIPGHRHDITCIRPPSPPKPPAGRPQTFA